MELRTASATLYHDYGVHLLVGHWRMMRTWGICFYQGYDTILDILGFCLMHIHSPCSLVFSLCYLDTILNEDQHHSSESISVMEARVNTS